MLPRTKAKMADPLAVIRAAMDELTDIIVKNADPLGEFSKTRHGVRAECLAAMDSVVSDVEQMLQTLTQIAAKARTSHNNQTKQLTSWAAVAASQPQKKHDTSRDRPRLPPPMTMVAERVGDMTMIARRVEHLEQVGPDLCYVPALNRFAVSIAGELLIGNVGTVYDVCIDPARVKECRFGGVSAMPSNEHTNRTPHCQKMGNGQCRYYHDPCLFPTSREPRNFFSTCGQYAPVGTPNGSNPNYCRFGSRATLRQDLDRITPEEARRFQDYVAHLFICWLIMKREKPQLLTR